LNGCVGWTPRTDEVVAGRTAKPVLVSNRTCIVVADVLAVNKDFAQKHPDKCALGARHLGRKRLLRDHQRNI